jgi:hypothetical protein
MANGQSYITTYYLGEYELYPGCNHQIASMSSYGFDTSTGVVYNVDFINSRYHKCAEVANPFLPTHGGREGTIGSETTYYYCYVMSSNFNDNSPYAVGMNVFTDPYITTTANQEQMQLDYPRINIPGTRNYYAMSPVGSYVSKNKVYEKVYTKIEQGSYIKPNYISLVSGYSLDDRKIANYPLVKPKASRTINIGYYRQNKLEGIEGLISIDWMTYSITVSANISIVLPIVDCVLGTLFCDDIDTSRLIVGIELPSDKYPFKYLFNSSISDLFAEWTAIYTTKQSMIAPLPAIPPEAENIILTQEIETSRTLRALGANNNVWKNKFIPVEDLNVDPTHPMFLVDEKRAYNWHIAPQTNNSGIGTLIMDSPRTIEIHAALNASQYLLEQPAIIGTGTIEYPQTSAKHKLDWYIKLPAKALGGSKYATYIDNKTGDELDRVSNLGWFVENIARVLGLRVDEKAYIDSTKEEDYFTREIINNPTYDKNAYSKNSFGRVGRLTPHLTNSNGSKAYDKIADIPQMMEACFEHLNRSIGIQQGTEIEVLNSTTGEKDYYPNQLAMLLDIHAKITEIQLNAKENHNLITVVAHELREIFSGVGIPITFKSLYNRYGQFMYIGHQSERGSILTSLTTLKVNIGMLVGNLLVDRPRDTRNPLERIFSKPKK